MLSSTNYTITGANNKPISLDLHLAGNEKLPIIIYMHGFNGFKDWGNGTGMGQWFNEKKLHFLKFNCSHNGTTPEHPLDFVDLEAFGNNNFTKQLYDLNTVIDWLFIPEHTFSTFIDFNQIILIGHSMGGGVCLLQASQDTRVNQLITWASIGAATTPWGRWSEEKIMDWQKEGVAFYYNSRTEQNLPLYYQLKQDYEKHKEQLNIPNAARKIKIPWLICYAKDDQAVPINIAHELHALQPNSELYIGNGGHTFGRTHPQNLPFSNATLELWQRTWQFIKQNNVSYNKNLQD